MRKRKVLELLTQALVDARMDRAEFSALSNEIPLPKTEAEVTEFIKQRTRVYRESWIISPLERAIKLIEQDGKRSEG